VVQIAGGSIHVKGDAVLTGEGWGQTGRNVCECNLTAFTHSSTGSVVHPFASLHEGPGFNPQGGYLCETRIFLLALSRYNDNIKRFGCAQF
jgi:hypothetical protein